MPLATQDVEYFMNEVRIGCPGASDAGIKQALWGIVKEFLQDSNAWTECIRLAVTAGTQTYNLAPRDGGQIVRLLGALDGNRVPVNATMPEFGVLSVATPIQVTSLIVPPSNTTTGANYPWYVGLVKNITLPATKDSIPIAPDFVMKVYSQTIVDGVIGKMMLQPATGYTNVPLGKYHLQRFRDGIGIARSEARVQNLFGGQRWQFPGYARGSQRGGVAIWPQEGRF